MRSISDLVDMGLEVSTADGAAHGNATLAALGAVVAGLAGGWVARDISHGIRGSDVRVGYGWGGCPLFWIHPDFSWGGYDTYSDAIVAAPDAETARRILPFAADGYNWMAKPLYREQYDSDYMSNWVSDDSVVAELIAERSIFLEPALVTSSFHAG